MTAPAAACMTEGAAGHGSMLDANLVPIRLGMGAVWIRTGYDKITGLEGVEGFFGGIGVPLPGVFALLVAIAELFGGIGLLVGVAPRFSGAVLTIVMLVATWKVSWPRGGWDASRLEIMLGLAALTVAINGAGRFNLPDMMGKPQLDFERGIIAKMRKKSE